MFNRDIGEMRIDSARVRESNPNSDTSLCNGWLSMGANDSAHIKEARKEL
jgi:hypothetical protein